jgi:hypothetical protein
MKILRKLFLALRNDSGARMGGYSAEVLLAGWVELPQAFHRQRRWPARAPAGTPPC